MKIVGDSGATRKLQRGLGGEWCRPDSRWRIRYSSCSTGNLVRKFLQNIELKGKEGITTIYRVLGRNT